MARLVGIPDSSFDAQRYRDAFGKNHGDPIVTEDLLQAVDDIREASTEELRQALRDSPLFVRARK